MSYLMGFINENALFWFVTLIGLLAFCFAERAVRGIEKRARDKRIRLAKARAQARYEEMLSEQSSRWDDYSCAVGESRNPHRLAGSVSNLRGSKLDLEPPRAARSHVQR